MSKITKKYAVVLILTVLTAFAVKELRGDYSKISNSSIETMERIPKNLQEKWYGQDFPLEEMVYNMLGTRAIIHRSFTDDVGNNVFLSIVHYADTKVDFHAPEVCFTAQGLQTEKTFEVVHLESDEAEKSINIAQLITTSQSGRSLSYYFYKTNNFMGSSYIKMRLSVAANKLLGNDPRGSLFRVSTKLEPGQMEKAKSILAEFLRDIIPFLNTEVVKK